MNKMKLLIGIGFFFITSIVLMGINPDRSTLSNISMDDNGEDNSSIITPPSIAATPNYKLGFNNTWGDSYNDEGGDITLDNSGNIYITG
ncbi:MAG: SBBP repeat-containing protein, partial [Promethearchaeota archaeon]